MRAYIGFQYSLNAELLDSGELVDAQGLAGPDVAKFVVSDGTNPPKVFDGPYPKSKELLAGYRLVDVDSLDRALVMAALASAVPAGRCADPAAHRGPAGAGSAPTRGSEAGLPPPWRALPAADGRRRPTAAAAAAAAGSPPPSVACR